MDEVMNKLRIYEEEKHRVLEERVPPLDLQGLSQGQGCSVNRQVENYRFPTLFPTSPKHGRRRQRYERLVLLCCRRNCMFTLQVAER